jgi:hypothetical protein
MALVDERIVTGPRAVSLIDGASSGKALSVTNRPRWVESAEEATSLPWRLGLAASCEPRTDPQGR